MLLTNKESRNENTKYKVNNRQEQQTDEENQ